ncbi:Predicted ATPase [Mycobacteroides abscessus subsp. abscessus]|uniref:protein kinase family protein n=1 Tax=Mycobacteroides abscessus TaxID=36809 RepID=UPI00092676A8|nr:protein kinase family protein [Mycobacteroides abscessus]SIH33990.1 Predicted ATPase [Mycobacteroides abscessus subsp. abscessus]
MDANEIITLIENADGPCDVFGPHPTNPAAARAAKRTYRIYANTVHPDRARASGLDAGVAAAAFTRLSALHQEWTQAHTGMRPGQPDGATIESHVDRYALGPRWAYGSIANIYAARNRAGHTVAVKIPRAASSSRFLDNERKALRVIESLCATGDNAWLTAYYPQLLDTVTHRGDTGESRAVNILSDLSRGQGYVTLDTVKNAIPEGLDGRDWAWIFRRLLRAVAGAHLAGVVHGAILPENVIIHPEGHGVVLAGWSFTTTVGRAVTGQVSSRRSFYPPEATTATEYTTDVYMAAALMEWILKPEEYAQRRFARGCMQDGPRRRPAAASLLQEYDELLETLYGPRTFRRFPYVIDAAPTA